MLAILQLPIADVRPFVPAETQRLVAPHWPEAEAGREFVRALGGIKLRRRRGIAPWGEDVYCDARRAVRFPRGMATLALAPGGVERRVRWAFRRYLADGAASTRFELGMYDRRPRGLGERVDLRAVAEACLSAPLELRSTAGDWVEAPFTRADTQLTQLLLRSTTRIAVGDAPETWWLRAGRALALVEYDADCVVAPAGAQVEILATVGVALSHQLVEHGGRPVTVWYLGHGRGTDPEALRRLRIHLLRLHAERECLKAVLREVIDGRLVPHRGTPADDALQAYLNVVLTRIFKPRYDGMPQAEILRVAYAADERVGEGERAVLRERLDHVRGNVLRKLEQRLDEPWFVL